METWHNLHVIYTREAETADMFIERATHELARQHRVRVVSSDGAEQIIILGQGARRLSASGLKEEVDAAMKELRQEWHERRQSSKNYLFDQMSDEMAEYMEEIRLGKKNS